MAMFTLDDWKLCSLRCCHNNTDMNTQQENERMDFQQGENILYILEAL